MIIGQTIVLRQEDFHSAIALSPAVLHEAERGYPSREWGYVVSDTLPPFQYRPDPDVGTYMVWATAHPARRCA